MNDNDIIFESFHLIKPPLAPNFQELISLKDLPKNETWPQVGDWIGKWQLYLGVIYIGRVINIYPHAGDSKNCKRPRSRYDILIYATSNENNLYPITKSIKVGTIKKGINLQNTCKIEQNNPLLKHNLFFQSLEKLFSNIK